MKALLVCDTDEPVKNIARFLRPYGFDCIRYHSAIKALDNLEEIAPDAVFISAKDFPRHWKVIVQFIRADADKARTIIILLVGDRFDAAEADKAVHIGVQAVLGERLATAEDERKLIEIFARYRRLEADQQYVEADHIGDHAAFLFTNPENDAIITGKIDGLSLKELRFWPDAPSATAELGIGEVLEQCSLKLDDAVLTPRCRVAKNGDLMILEFISAGKEETEAIERFIAGTR